MDLLWRAWLEDLRYLYCTLGMVFARRQPQGLVDLLWCVLEDLRYLDALTVWFLPCGTLSFVDLPACLA